MNEIITADYFALKYAENIFLKAFGKKPRILFDKSQARRKSMVTDLFKVEYPFIVVMREGVELLQRFPFFLTYTAQQSESTIQYRVPELYKINYKAIFYLLKESEVTQVLSSARSDVIIEKAAVAAFDLVVENWSDRMINPSTDELVFVAEINYHIKTLVHMERYQEFPRKPHLNMTIQVDEKVSTMKPLFKKKRKVI